MCQLALGEVSQQKSVSIGILDKGELPDDLSKLLLPILLNVLSLQYFGLFVPLDLQIVHFRSVVLLTEPHFVLDLVHLANEIGAFFSKAEVV